MEKSIQYFGEWQKGNNLLDKLEGPKGDGRVEFPNGDKFGGVFHLNYAHINGSCYVAFGRYVFADGSYIDNAWINTSADLSKFGLKGVFEVKNVDGTLRSITSFHMNKRHGVELLLSEPLEAIEWYEGEEVGRYQVADYSLERVNEDQLTMTVNLVDGHVIKMYSGTLDKNSYNQYYFTTYLKGGVICPNGEMFESVNYGIRNLRPYDGFVSVWGTDGGKLRSEEYNKGKLIEVRDGGWNERNAVAKMLPNPIHPIQECEAKVWNGHIEYDFGAAYNGELLNGLPHGRGVLSYADGVSFEGEFVEGRCSGMIVYTVPSQDIRKECVWNNGEIEDAPASITLRYSWKCVDFYDGKDSERRSNEGSFVVYLGMSLDIEGFKYLKVVDISEEEVKLNGCTLRKGKETSFENEIEDVEVRGDTVWKGCWYYMTVSWD